LTERGSSDSKRSTPGDLKDRKTIVSQGADAEDKSPEEGGGSYSKFGLTLGGFKLEIEISTSEKCDIQTGDLVCRAVSISKSCKSAFCSESIPAGYLIIVTAMLIMLGSHTVGFFTLEKVINQTLSLLFGLGIALISIELQRGDR
jgi:hypothetical protein